MRWRTLLGLEDREVWGMAPIDIGCCASAAVTPSNAHKDAEEHSRGHHHETGPDWTIFGTREPISRWGEPQPSLHPDRQSLFLDLIFVGIAFQLGEMLKHSFYSCTPDSASGSASGSDSGSTSGHGRLLGASAPLHPCVGLADGLFHTIVLFSCVFSHWLQDSNWDAKYAVSGKIDAAFSFVFLSCLMFAASNIADVHVLQTDGYSLWFFCVFNVACTFIWIVRYACIAVAGIEANMRRESWTMLLSLLVQLALLLAALGLASDPVVDDGTYHIVLWLMWSSTTVWPLRQAWRSLVAPPSLRERYREVSTPLNVNLLITRVNEFIMLMLGESVLQLVAATEPEKARATDLDGIVSTTSRMGTYAAVEICGLIVALAVLHCHASTAPSDAAQHAASHGPIHAFVGFFPGITLKCLSFMLVGISIKLSLADPLLEDAQSSEQRLLLGLSLALSFGVAFFLKGLHQGARAVLAPVLSGTTPVITACYLARLGLTIAMLAVSAIDLVPWQFMVLQACLATGHVLALHGEDVERYRRNLQLHGQGQKQQAKQQVDV